MLDALSTDWSRPYKIVRVLQALGMEVPQRLRKERLAGLLEALGRADIEAQLADGEPIDVTDSPGIEAKIRLRRRASQAVAAREMGFEVLARIPGGGMAQCFKVLDGNGTIRFLKKVAIGDGNANALRRELDIYTRLDRAQAGHVLRVIERVEADGYFGLVIEFADGGTLAEHREPQVNLSPKEVKPIALAVAEGLSELHSLEIVHRDLKPANVLRVGQAWKLADFGISKSLARLVTRGPTFQCSGTPGYSPPEQWAGREAHTSADVYAFGKLLVFLLSGETDIDHLIQQDGWAKLVRRCTQEDPATRLSVSQIKDELAQL